MDWTGLDFPDGTQILFPVIGCAGDRLHQLLPGWSEAFMPIVCARQHDGIVVGQIVANEHEFSHPPLYDSLVRHDTPHTFHLVGGNLCQIGGLASY